MNRVAAADHACVDTSESDHEAQRPSGPGRQASPAPGRGSSRSGRDRHRARLGQRPRRRPAIRGYSSGYLRWIRPVVRLQRLHVLPFQLNSDCYAYSRNIASSSFAQPGRMHGYLYACPPTGPGVRTGAEEDGWIYVVATFEDNAGYAESSGAGRYTSLLIWPADTPNHWPGDHRWVLCDDPNSYQSRLQKDGDDAVTNCDFAGNHQSRRRVLERPPGSDQPGEPGRPGRRLRIPRSHVRALRRGQHHLTHADRRHGSPPAAEDAGLPARTGARVSR